MKRFIVKLLARGINLAIRAAIIILDTCDYASIVLQNLLLKALIKRLKPATATSR